MRLSTWREHASTTDKSFVQQKEKIAVMTGRILFRCLPFPIRVQASVCSKYLF